jgi:UDP-N-acetylmuramoyl-L-alanyl-D-glutamate--2,6-diaminopimelate ligase
MTRGKPPFCKEVPIPGEAGGLLPEARRGNTSCTPRTFAKLRLHHPRTLPPMAQKTGTTSDRTAISLTALVGGITDLEVTGDVSGRTVREVRFRSADVEPGDLFVALSGSAADGHDFVEDAVSRGAVAVMVERAMEADLLPVPVMRVPDARRALAELAAAFHGFPARDLFLIGISGTVGKTSVLALLEKILLQAGLRMGSVGSLGVHIAGKTVEETGYTAPDPLLLQQSLRRVRDAGCSIAAMEVTSHALDQKRVHGLEYDLGIFIKLLPLEHQDYHGSFSDYVATKRQFFDQIRPGSPLVYNADDPALEALFAENDLVRVPCGTSEGAEVRIEEVAVTAAGTELLLHAERGVPLRDGGRSEPLELELSLQLLGMSNIHNAALAAAAALVLGVEGGDIRRALAAVPPPRRRMEMIHRGEFDVIDDTVGHPESVTAVFLASQALKPRGIHIAFAVRGNRGPEINHHIAETLAVWSDRLGIATLVITTSDESADERNEVVEEELSAFLTPLESAGIPFRLIRRLDEAIGEVMSRAASGDLVLLLGAQGMDEGAEHAKNWLRENRKAE